jgi:hypothetical protein
LGDDRVDGLAVSFDGGLVEAVAHRFGHVHLDLK